MKTTTNVIKATDHRNLHFILKETMETRNPNSRKLTCNKEKGKMNILF